jgi:hypothetical protein
MNHNAYTSVTVPEKDANANREFDWTKYFGASVLAFTKLMIIFDYQLVHVDATQTNAFYIAKSELNNTDLALLAWTVRVQKKPNESQIGFHPIDKQNRTLTHICSSLPCSSLAHF